MEAFKLFACSVEQYFTAGIVLYHEKTKQRQNPSFISCGCVTAVQNITANDLTSGQPYTCTVGLSFFFLFLSLSYFTVPLILQDFSQSLCVCALCQIAVWLLEADTAAWLLAKLRAEYQCSATVTAGNICPFKMERGGKCNIEGEGENGDGGKDKRNKTRGNWKEHIV